MEINQNSQKKIIINTCHTCRTPIYEGEPIYGSSRGSSFGYTSGGYAGKNQVGGYSGYYSGAHGSEAWAQCAWCYDQWQTEIANNKNFWFWWRMGGILIVIIVIIVSIMMIPGLEQNGIRGENINNPQDSQNRIPWYKIKIFSLGSYKVPLITPIVFFASFILINILGKIFQPKVNRYKLRKRPIKL